MTPSETDGSELMVEVDGPIATLWLNRPEKRNAVTLPMWTELAQRSEALAEDPDVRLLVLRGVGDHFCAGADVAGMGEVSPEEYRAANIAADEAIATFPKPTICFVRGACIGGGAEIAIACDLRVADTTARFGITPARLGIVYPAPAVQRAVRLIGPSATKHLLYSAEIIDVDRAVRIGLVDEVHGEQQAEARLDELAQLLTGERSLLTQMASKEMVDAAVEGEVPPGAERRWVEEMTDGADSVEGVVAFLERRSPNFTWTHGP